MIFETDSVQIARALNDRTYKPDYSSTFIKDYHHLMYGFSSVKFQHVKRSCNKVAYEMAKIGLGIDEIKVWIDGGPHKAMTLVMADKESITLYLSLIHI